MLRPFSADYIYLQNKFNTETKQKKRSHHFSLHEFPRSASNTLAQWQEHVYRKMGVADFNARQALVESRIEVDRALGDQTPVDLSHIAVHAVQAPRVQYVSQASDKL